MDLFSRIGLGTRRTPLEADLHRITETDNIDAPPKDVLTSVSQSSHDPEDRAVIMRHLQECLSETSGRRWRRIHGGLVLLDQLLRYGAPALVEEVSAGLHFDPIQRLTFLERFEYGDDRRVQNIVRQKAGTLRSQLIAAMQAAQDGIDGAGFGVNGAAASRGVAGHSRGSVEGTSATSYSSASFNNGNGYPASFGNGSPSGSKKPVVVNGLVSTGHRDDTSSESSGGEGVAASKRGGANGRKKAPAVRSNGGGGLVDVRRRDVLEESTDSEEDTRQSRRAPKHRSKVAAPAQRAPAPAPPVDLLDMTPDRPAQSAATAPAPSENLLDM